MDGSPPAPTGAAWPAGRSLRLATRGSPLARRQSDIVAHLLAQAHPGLAVETVVVRTEGDRRAEESLEQIGGQGVFVKEVQQAVLDGRADVAVHSAKDLPSETPAGLTIAAVPPRADARDALVGASLPELRPGARVATGSARRRVQLANLRPDLCFVALRGNIETRLSRVGSGHAEAVVVAVAALERLSVLSQATQILSELTVLPQVGQGAIALECAAGDGATAALLGLVDHLPSRRAVTSERAMLRTLGASCVLPVGGWATADGDELHLRAMIATPDGRVVVHADGRGGDPEALGASVATTLLGRAGSDAVVGQGVGDRPARP